MSYKYLILKFSEKGVRRFVKLFPLWQFGWKRKPMAIYHTISNNTFSRGSYFQITTYLIAELGPTKLIEVKARFNCTGHCKSKIKTGKVLHFGIKNWFTNENRMRTFINNYIFMQCIPQVCPTDKMALQLSHSTFLHMSYVLLCWKWCYNPSGFYWLTSYYVTEG